MTKEEAFQKWWKEWEGQAHGRDRYRQAFVAGYDAARAEESKQSHSRYETLVIETCRDLGER